MTYLTLPRKYKASNKLLVSKNRQVFVKKINRYQNFGFEIRLRILRASRFYRDVEPSLRYITLTL